jgi:FkbM family methyltransferase
MDRFPHGRPDFVAHMSVRGWWDWEDPLPVAFAALASLFPGAFYDVGANTGFYSILLARLDARRPVRAFEPDPAIAGIGRSNVALAGLGNATYETVAVGDRDGTAVLHVPEGVADMIETRSSLQGVDDPRDVFAVPSVRVDTLSADQALGILKVDVEGGEPDVLTGAQETLRRDRPAVSVEVLPDADTARLTALAHTAGYASVRMLPGLQYYLSDELAHDPASPNHLLLPRERVPQCLDALRSARAQFAALRRALAGADAQAFLREQTALLPPEVLADQVCVSHRLLECERGHVDRLAMEVGALRERL